MTYQKQFRPIPADFAEQAALLSRKALAKHYGARVDTVVRWASEAGIPPRSNVGCKQRPVPADFAQYAAVETYDELIRRYRASTNLLARWRRMVGVTRQVTLLPPPEGFRLVAPNHTVRELRVRYGRSFDTIYRWCQLCGVEPRKAAPLAAGASTRNFHPQNHAHRDTTRAGMAADFLRRLGPVFRCTPEGRAKPDGTHWNRGGRTILTDAEIIERAERNGWRPDAWKEIAAA